MTVTALTLIAISIASALGWALGNIKYRNISLGVSGVLFAGLFIGHFMQQWQLTVDRPILEFLRDFGLILFIFSIGLQMGRGFWEALLKHGKLLNCLALSSVLISSALVFIICKFGFIDLASMVGIYSGAVTNTPTLGAGQQMLEMYSKGGMDTAGLGYAMTYPFGVIGVILCILILKIILRISLKDEVAAYEKTAHADNEEIIETEMEITNPFCNDLALCAIPGMFKQGVVTTVVYRGGEEFVPNLKTIVFTGDVLHLVGPTSHIEEMKIVLGGDKKALLNIKDKEKHFKTQKVMVTNYLILGKPVSEVFDLNNKKVMISRLKRQGIEMAVTKDTLLCFGDILTITSDPADLMGAISIAGNDSIAMDKIRLFPLFTGITLGILFGLIPFTIPGLSFPVRLGIAGGPLLVAIYLARLGNIGPIVWYLPRAANNFMKDLGITLFLAVVGIIAGTHFWEMLISEKGLEWIGYGAIVTVIPIFITGILGRLLLKLNFLTLSGVLCASMTNPTAMAFSAAISASDGPISAYITAYPLTVVARIVSIQILFILLLL